jgi:hypothetical protein
MSGAGENLYTFDDAEDDGLLEPADDLSTDDYADDPLDAGIAPPDKYGASTWHGITEAEARRGETLDQLLAEEEPEPTAFFAEDDRGAADFGGPGGDLDESVDEVPGEHGDGGPEIDDRWREGPGPRSGRLVGDGRLTATDVGPDGDAAGAEEAAVHLMEDNELRYHPIHDDAPRHEGAED